jgi:hypothetical protein
MGILLSSTQELKPLVTLSAAKGLEINSRIVTVVAVALTLKDEEKTLFWVFLFSLDSLT